MKFHAAIISIIALTSALSTAEASSAFIPEGIGSSPGPQFVGPVISFGGGVEAVEADFGRKCQPGWVLVDVASEGGWRKAKCAAVGDLKDPS